MSKEKIIIVGAGLCGSMLAIRLAELGYDIELIESRPDLRATDISAGRSINLALSNRGLKALDMVGLKEAAKAISIPMQGRLIHTETGQKKMSPYSGRKEDHINSISRGGLNGLLLDKAESFSNVTMYFNSPCRTVDIDKGEVLLDNGEVVTGDIIIGTDGAGSVVRKAYMNRRGNFLFNYSQDYLQHGYMELTIPPAEGGGFRIENNVLHIWPRGSFMLIALPNLDGSFTVTLFLAYTNAKRSFDQLETDEAIMEFFQTEFPDVVPHIPDLVKEYRRNPVGRLGTVKCFPWQIDDRSLLMGDAAHAIVPFYGQGMNASFEDVLVFDQIFQDNDHDWAKSMEAYQAYRKIDTDAIADLAIDNFYEMRDHVANPIFMKKRDLEMKLEATFESYYSKYSMVTFKEDMRYHEAMNRGRKQDKELLKLCSSDRYGDVPLHEIKENVEQAGLKKEDSLL